MKTQKPRIRTLKLTAVSRFASNSMKRIAHAAVAVVGLALLCSLARAASTPVAPSPISDARDARTPIFSVTNITQPGSYYLRANIAITAGTAITISASGVTLDLNGFTISSTEASPAGTAILLSGNVSDITILNGHILGHVTSSGGVYSGSGFLNGISSEFARPNVRVTGISVSGCLGRGILSRVVGSCAVDTVGGAGILATTVTDSTALNCGYLAIGANNAQNCVGESWNGNGIDAVTANNCSGSSRNGVGLVAQVANNCTAFSDSGDGLHSNWIAIGCLGESASGRGLDVFIANSCYGTGSSPEQVAFKYNMP